jgi:hypothetical protein
VYRRDGNMKALRFLATAVLGVALVPLGAGAASAEPPPTMTTPERLS